MAKVAKPVNRLLFEEAIKVAEKDGPVASLSELYRQVADIYNHYKDVTPITHSVVMLRIKEWEIDVKTTGGALPVDRVKLVAALNEAEKEGPLANMGLLWTAAADIYNKTASVPITFSVVSLRVKEWGIKVKTQPGKRGGPMTEEHKAALLAGRGERKPRSEKMKEYASTFEKIRNKINNLGERGRRFLPIVDAAEGGSLRAAVKLNCLDCSCYQTTEIKHCGIDSCAWFPHRPYKPGDEDENEVGRPEVEEVEEAA